MVYPKRRAPVACDYCRRRKRRCSGEQPSCSLCLSFGRICQYSYLIAETQSNQGHETSNEELRRRVQDLEFIVKRQRSEDQRENPTQITSTSPVAERLSDRPLGLKDSVATAYGLADSHTEALESYSSSYPNICLGRPIPSATGPQYQSLRLDTEASNDAPMIIPHGHHTISASLFLLQPIRALIGDYPVDFFYQIESSRFEIPAGLSHQHLQTRLRNGEVDTQSLISNYFQRVQPLFPILDPESFDVIYQRGIQSDGGSEVDLALSLVVLALGELSVFDTKSTENTHRDSQAPGMQHFSYAYHSLTKKWLEDLRPDRSLASGLILAAVYMLYLARPVHAWNLVSMASSRLQLLNIQYTNSWFLTLDWN
ncbi:hypothetical protein F5B20DRAFT_343521 [Whalleya microplaca]|nr:hypothetical protein F5B20DRAFT_343521 [Whalleya microplaca]